MRFFAVVHLACMLVAVALAHVGAVTGRRASDEPTRVRHRRALRCALRCALLAVVLVALGVPWWRPLYSEFP